MRTSTRLGPMAEAGPSLGPTPAPICAAPYCLMCTIARRSEEARREFLSRLSRLYWEGRLW